MKQPQYSRCERGLRDIATDILIRPAKLYRTSTDYILGITDDSSEKNHPIRAVAWGGCFFRPLPQKVHTFFAENLFTKCYFCGMIGCNDSKGGVRNQ